MCPAAPIKDIAYVFGTNVIDARKIKEKFPDAMILALEPKQLPILTEGINIGSHKIEGIGDDFVPDLVDREVIDDIILVNDDDAINMSRILAKELGLGVGISSGANFIASVLSNFKIKNPIVTVFADDNKKYFSTDLSKEIDRNEKFISNKIKLLNYEVLE